jgi:molybdopterin-binding protein
MHGIVTRVVKHTVMTQVDMQAGPFRIVSLMSREGVDELGLDLGVVAIASIKSTHVVMGISTESAGTPWWRPCGRPRARRHRRW